MSEKHKNGRKKLARANADQWAKTSPIKTGAA
jgi:hypothetical protein